MKTTDLNKAKILKEVSEFCHSRLWNDEAAMVYLKDHRKLTDQIIKKFQIGLFPKDIRELFQVIGPETLRDAEIIRHASKSVFQTRDIIIPIKDVYGRYIALAGRTRLSEEKRLKYNISKYINSVYPKAQNLFGLNLAKKSILETGVAYVVEGHYDVITPHQHGMTNIVATCSSSLSTRQIALLARYTNKIVLLFDNEPTAKEQARKIVEKKQQKGITLITQAPFPPDVKDIDEYLHQYPMSTLSARLKDGGEFNDIKPSWD